ncbi:MAG: hypothetical protein EXQ97_07445 [Alphaproteobacteria bacterium]|nr:hypothetical protein [Alphaproteobacteria bacterium]
MKARGGDLAGAAVAFREELAVQPCALEVRRNLARALLYLGEAGAAAEEWRRLCDAVPGDAAALVALGRAMLDAGDLQGAEAALAAAIGGGAASPETHNALGAARWQQGCIVEAEAAFCAALALAQADATAHANRAGKMRKQARLDEAIIAYRTAVALATDVA